MNIYKKLTHKEGIDVSELCYTIALCLYLGLNMLLGSQFDSFAFWPWFSRIIKLFVLIFLLISLILSDFVKEMWIYTAMAIVFLFLISGFFSNQIKEMFFLGIIIAFGIFIHSNKPFQACLIMMICLTVLVVVADYFNFFPIKSIQATDTRSERLYFGFKWPMILPNYFFHILLVYFAIKKGNINLIETFLILTINQYIYMYTDTRSVYLCVFFLLLLMWLLRIKPSLFASKAFKFCSMIAMPFLAIVIVFISMRYTPNSHILAKLNEIISSRLSLGHQAIERYGFSLFGTHINWSNGQEGVQRVKNYFYVDSSYLNILLNYGLFLIVFLLSSFIYLIKNSLSERKYKLTIVLLLLVIRSFLDDQLFVLRYDAFLVLLVSNLVNGHIPIGYRGNDVKAKTTTSFLLSKKEFREAGNDGNRI